MTAGARRWLGGRPWLVLLVIMVAGNVIGWRSLEAETDRRIDADRRQEQVLDDREEVRECRTTNGNRHELRHALGKALIDNLVEASGGPVDPGLVERTRRGIVDDLTRDFPDEDCDALAKRLAEE